MIPDLALRDRQHQPDTAAVKKSESRRRLEQERKSQHVPVKSNRSPDIGNRDGNLSDPLYFRFISHGLILQTTIVRAPEREHQ